MTNEKTAPDDAGNSLTLDCIDFWLDGPGDHTVRPIPPERLEHAKAERAKIQAALAVASNAESGKRGND